MKKVPELRFKEFKDEWKEEKLGDIGNIIYGKGLTSDNYDNNGDSLIIGTGGIIAKSYSFIDKGETIIIPRKGTISRVFYFKKNQKFWTIDTTFYLKLSESISYKFIYFYFKKINLEFLNESTGVPSLNINNLKKILFFLPSSTEQQKIALFLSSIDKKIELTDKKLEFLEKYKKGLMQKLLTGKIRFPGFKDEWKEEKLGNFIKIQGGYAFKNKLFKEKGIPIIRISNLSIDGKYTNINNLVYYDKTENDNNFIIKRNDLLIAMSGATAGKVSVYNKKNIAYLNQRVGLFKLIKFDKLDYNYMTQYAFSNFFNNQLKSLLATSAQPNISSKDIEKLKIKLSSLPEQQKIASFLSAIDKKIELIKSRFENLKKYKKGLFQKMFV